MINHNNIEAIFAATYLENYFNCIDSLSDDVQRYISEIRRLDSQNFDALTKIQELRTDYQEVCRLSSKTKSNSAKSSNSGNKNILIDKKRSIIRRISQLLIECQTISDEKLKQVSSLTEILEHKWTQLEFDAKSLDMDHSDLGLNVRPTSLNLRSTSPHSFKSPDDSYLSSCAANVTLRSERRMLGDSFLESQSISSSQTSSNSNLNAKGGQGGYHKRTRRQKQFPDFVRDADVGDTVCPQILQSSSRREKPASVNSVTSSTSNSVANVDNFVTSPTMTTPTSSNNNNNSIAGGGNKRRRKLNQTVSSGNEIPTPGVSVSSNSKTQKFTVPADPDEPTYCLCDQISYGEMIGCDNTKCEIEWFHFNCVGLTGKPKGKWFCPNCRGDRQNVMKD